MRSNREVRVYLFVEARWAIENIRKQRLKVCRFSDLNDPFELLAGRQNNLAFRAKLKGWAKKINEQYGLLCFTTDWEDPVMWSHYGDRHKGMCLGFNVEDLSPINYVNKRLPFDEWKTFDALPKEDAERLLTTKCARWCYERERRLIINLAKNSTEEGGHRFKSFDHKLKLVEVIAGPRCCVKWKPYIMDAVKKLPVRLLKARLAFKEFTVVPQKHNNSRDDGFKVDAYWTECVCRGLPPHDVMDSAT